MLIGFQSGTNRQDGPLTHRFTSPLFHCVRRRTLSKSVISRDFELSMVINLAPPKSVSGPNDVISRHVLLPSPYFLSDFDSLHKISNLRAANR